MSGKDDGIGGLILLGGAVLVGLAFLGGGGRKREVDVPMVEEPPEVEESERSAYCSVCGSTDSDLRKCDDCDNLVCRQHETTCWCGLLCGCPDHKPGVYCQSCE